MFKLLFFAAFLIICRSTVSIKFTPKSASDLSQLTPATSGITIIAGVEEPTDGTQTFPGSIIAFAGEDVNNLWVNAVFVYVSSATDTTSYQKQLTIDFTE